MPDDVWNEYPRICGTFSERTGFPCQMPESLLARIIRASSNEGDWVLDPFCGSGTTATVAYKLGRHYTTIDLSETYVEATRQRIAESNGLPVEGNGRLDWPEHADAELRWLYSENKIPAGNSVRSRFLLTLFTKKLNQRLQKRQPLHVRAGQQAAETARKQPQSSRHRKRSWKWRPRRLKDRKPLRHHDFLCSASAPCC